MKSKPSEVAIAFDVAATILARELQIQLHLAQRVLQDEVLGGSLRKHSFQRPRVHLDGVVVITAGTNLERMYIKAAPFWEFLRAHARKAASRDTPELQREAEAIAADLGNRTNRSRPPTKKEVVGILAAHHKDKAESSLYKEIRPTWLAARRRKS